MPATGATSVPSDGAAWTTPPVHGRLVRRIQRETGRRFCLDLGQDHRSAILVAGSGRSGTSWLAELLNHRNEYHYIFEPFHPPEFDSPVPIEVGLKSCSNFTYHLYLRPDDADPRYLRPAAEVLAGRVRSGWTEQYNRRLFATRRIVKEVTANLLLPWFAANFPGMPIVLILRHPCAVAASRGSLNWDTRWELVLSRVLRQPALLEDVVGPFVDLFERASSYVERQVLMWCLDNYVPLRRLGAKDIHIVFYEELVAQPEAEIPRLLNFLGKPVDPSIFDAMRRPSMLSDWNSPTLKGASRTATWKTKLDASDVRRAMAVLAAFGLNAIYADDPMPNAAGLSELMAPAREAG